MPEGTKMSSNEQDGVLAAMVPSGLQSFCRDISTRKKRGEVSNE